LLALGGSCEALTPELAVGIEQLGESEADLRSTIKQAPLTQKVSGSILDRFRAVRNSDTEVGSRLAANDSKRVIAPRGKSVIPSFLIMGRD
jgi:hypothetical protein